MAERLGDASIQPEYIRMMNTVAGVLDEAFNGLARGPDRKVGFILMVFPFGEDYGDDARCNYISNGANRRDVVLLLKEQVKRFEEQLELEKEGKK